MLSHFILRPFCFQLWSCRYRLETYCSSCSGRFRLGHQRCKRLCIGWTLGCLEGTRVCYQRFCRKNLQFFQYQCIRCSWSGIGETGLSKLHRHSHTKRNAGLKQKIGKIKVVSFLNNYKLFNFSNFSIWVALNYWTLSLLQCCFWKNLSGTYFSGRIFCPVTWQTNWNFCWLLRRARLLFLDPRMWRVEFKQPPFLLGIGGFGALKKLCWLEVSAPRYHPQKWPLGHCKSLKNYLNCKDLASKTECPCFNFELSSNLHPNLCPLNLYNHWQEEAHL